MKTKRLILFLIVFLSLNKLFSMGFGYWEANTKYNTNFNFPGGWLAITLTNGKTYENPIKWYFYKGNIIVIGKEHLQGNQEPVFFVINENKKKWIILTSLTPTILFLFYLLEKFLRAVKQQYSPYHTKITTSYIKYNT